ncbi:MAG: hypothetical protein GY953_25095, partial [bacterium]|nr:hypothetical protein [bacterium]
AVSAVAADATGKWTGEYETPRGKREVTYDLKAEGDQLTGKVITTRGESDIEEGKVSGDEISFVRVLKLQERELRMLHKGKVSGDEIQFTVTFGDRPPMEFVVKRAK